MIEKLMKAVKRGNKKRGRNIAIGAVVGFLLSCTAVMGADEYLWIGNNGGKIGFNTASTAEIDGSDGNWQDKNPYSENIWSGSIYVNNITLSSNANNGKIDDTYGGRDVSYGIRFSVDLSGFINNGLIAGVSNIENYGIINTENIGSITNNGSIEIENTEGSGMASAFGILNNGNIETLTNNGNIETLINKGLIIGTTSSNSGISSSGKIGILTNDGLIMGIGNNYGGSGIHFYDGKVTTLANNGLITGASIFSSGFGINNSAEKITILINNGSITGEGVTGSSGIRNDAYSRNALIEHIANSGIITGQSYGIYNKDNGVIEVVTNTGVVYGNTNAVKNDTTITSLNNYGILATKGNAVINGTITNMENNYGLYIERTTGVVTKGSGGKKAVKIGDSEREMTIKNADITGGSGIGTSTESFEFSGNPTEFDNSILNGKDDTLKVSGAGNEITGSTINAYETAILFNNSISGELTLSGTIVNGEASGSNRTIINGTDIKETLILRSGEITYKDGTKGTQNTIINGNISMLDGDDVLVIGTGTIINGDIDMGDNNDLLTIEAGSVINGTLDGGVGNDTLNFNSTVTRTATNDGINIQHNISEFQNMNINTNVTLFEKTVAGDGSIMEV
ncbi:hypothetical protein [uncultured Fusobacterium sp.]|uniref:beta strand repeat-containing protein n=1 Tax=uncultured Fusobacterium sp. TaxID=159267 RepID=UPI0034332BB9